ncbi:hypothetical protein GCM10029976_090440 [Kribbella albertanoniae]|uniref:hypothetical protein n=1 Tax=Kribbella albertanoniae TaxID=1266829 RepID=UPI0014050697|nr:hypothetical protein [Kribbella albertanoniae]
MSTGITVHMPARDQKDGLTLDELARFVEHCKTAGVKPEAHITANVSWRSAVREIGIRL